VEGRSIGREEALTDAVDTFLNRGGRPHLQIRGTGDDEYRLDGSTGTSPQLEGVPCAVVFVLFSTSSDAHGRFYFVGAETLGEGELFQNDHEEEIIGKINYGSWRHLGSVFVHNGKGKWYPHIRLDHKREVYSIITKEPGENDVAVGPEIRPKPKSKKKPKEAPKTNRSFNSVDDFRDALQKGDFER